jgi:hypothetical protein
MSINILNKNQRLLSLSTLDEELENSINRESSLPLIQKNSALSNKIKTFPIKIKQINSYINSSATGNSFENKEKNNELLERRNENIRRNLN